MLATDEVQTLAVFIYKDINWGQGAQIGFNVGDGYTAFVFPEALSDETRNINEYSNVGEPGIFIYRIDGRSSFSLPLFLLFFLSLSHFSTPFSLLPPCMKGACAMLFLNVLLQQFTEYYFATVTIVKLFHARLKSYWDNPLKVSGI